MIITAWLEFERAYFETAIQNFSHDATCNKSFEVYSSIINYSLITQKER